MQNLSSGFVEWSCAVVITTTPECHRLYPLLWNFDTLKNLAVFGEILDFSNIFSFLVVNWAPKLSKTVNFGCISFEPKFKILKNFPKTLFVLLSTTSGQNFSKIKQYLGEYGPTQKNWKGAISWMLNQPHMLYWWNLPQRYFLTVLQIKEQKAPPPPFLAPFLPVLPL